MDQQENESKGDGCLGCLGVSGIVLVCILLLVLETWLHCAVTAWMVRRFFM